MNLQSIVTYLLVAVALVVDRLHSTDHQELVEPVVLVAIDQASGAGAMANRINLKTRIYLLDSLDNLAPILNMGHLAKGVAVGKERVLH